jgi:hypothetical protein
MIWLEYNIRRVGNSIIVDLEKKSEIESINPFTTGARVRGMPTISTIASKRFRIGVFDTMTSLLRKIEKIKFRMFQNFKKTEQQYKNIDRLCDELSKGKKILCDDQTERFIKNLT